MSAVITIDAGAVRNLRAAWAAGQPPADPWFTNDPHHGTAWAYAPRKLHPDFIPTIPVTREMVRQLVARGAALRAARARTWK